MKLLRLLLLAVVAGLLTSPALAVEEPTTGAENDPRFEEVNGLLHDGDIAEALDLLNTLAADFPEDSTIDYTRALAFYINGEPDRALASLDDAIQRQESAEAAPAALSASYLLRARVNLQRGAVEDALSDYAEAIRYQPENVQPYLSRARLYESTQEYERALADYSRALELQPENTDILIQRANAALQADDPESALADMDLAVEILPEDPQLYIIRAKVHVILRDDRAAAQDYVTWLERITQSDETLDSVNAEAGATLEIDMELGSLYRIPFEATVGQLVYTMATSPTVDGLIVILDPEGEPLVADDDSGGDLNPFIHGYALPMSGTYTLLVGHARGGFTGTLELILTTVTGESARIEPVTVSES